MAADQKQELLEFCRDFVHKRIARIQQNIADIQTALTAETKSSAGDKHETGRAMVQLEREKLGQQLAEAEKMHQTLLKVPLKPLSDHVGTGSWVRTTTAQYFLAISAGKCTVTNNVVYCISAATPIGKLLLGKAVGESINFNGRQMQILEIA